MCFVSEIVSIFGNNVQHLHGNLFRVKRDKIKFANQGLSVQDGKLIYGNPRWYKNKQGIDEAKGIDEKQKMQELESSIQDEGLENPIRLRVLKDKKILELVNGERRLRSIDQLCEKDLKCFDSATNEQKNAKEVFEWIDARIDFMDDKTALRVALRPNETSEIIGESANLNVIKIMRESGHDDQEILKATGKSISWLRDTDQIIGLDESSFEHFAQEKINRTVALHLAKIEDLDDRLELLERITNSAIARHSEKKKSIAEQKEKIKKKAEIEEAKKELASKYGEEEESEIHEQKSNKAKIQLKKLEQQEEDLDESGPIATSKDIKNAIKPLSHKKIKSIYIDTIDDIIQNEGCDEDGNLYGYDISILQILSSVLSSIMNGDKDIMQILNDNLIESDSQDSQDEDDEEQEEYEEYEEDDISDEDMEYDEDEEEYDEFEEETPIELEREFEEAAFNEEDFD